MMVSAGNLVKFLSWQRLCLPAHSLHHLKQRIATLGVPFERTSNAALLFDQRQALAGLQHESK
jgi:hypothetical protein